MSRIVPDYENPCKMPGNPYLRSFYVFSKFAKCENKLLSSKNGKDQAFQSNLVFTFSF